MVAGLHGEAERDPAPRDSYSEPSCLGLGVETVSTCRGHVSVRSEDVSSRPAFQRGIAAVSLLRVVPCPSQEVQGVSPSHQTLP